MTEATATKDKKKDEPKDSFRDLTETVVFVVVLVLMLKLFVAEAFVIPTGSMAETLYGHHKNATCAECGLKFPVNCADEVEPQRGRFPTPVAGYVCPNCRHLGRWNPEDAPSARSGDRVLVFKPEYHLFSPQRFDVPVFKFPERPQENWTAVNYIKRLIGLPGDTIGIYAGDIYSARLDYPADAVDANGDPRYPRPDAKLKETDFDLWRPRFMYQSYHDPKVLTEYDYDILRKPPAKLLEMARVVYDNDHQPKSLAGVVPPRWKPENRPAWTFDDDKAPRVFTVSSPDEVAFIRYQHLVPNWCEPEKTKVQPITTFLGYNNGISKGNTDVCATDDRGSWTGDLILEAEVDSDSDDGEVVLELSKSVDRFQARFNLADGTCTLFRNNADGRKEMAKQPSSVKGKGKHRVRFANVDRELTVWVGSRAMRFGHDARYQPPPARQAFDPEDTRHEGWFRENDVLAPASVGVRGKATVRHVRLSRDTYYTSPRTESVDTYYVQPGHYFCLGDNSEASADSRSWGTVPERLLLGRALTVYYPIPRIGLIE